MNMNFDHNSPKAIRNNKHPAGFGKPCASCGEPMQRWEHTPGWRPTVGKGWHAHWFTCVRGDCDRLQKVVYEAGRFRHDNPYKLAAFDDVVLKGRLLKRIAKLQAEVDRDELSDDQFSARVGEIEAMMRKGTSE